MLSLLFIIDFHTTVWVLSVSISKNQFWTFPKRGSGSAFPGGVCALHGCKGTYITTCKRRKECASCRWLRCCCCSVAPLQSLRNPRASYLAAGRSCIPTAVAGAPTLTSPPDSILAGLIIFRA